MTQSLQKIKRIYFNLLKAANRNKARDNLGHNATAKETKDESSKEEVPFINEVSILPAVANAVVPAGKQNAVTAETTTPNKPAAYHLASQPLATNNSAVPDAPIQSLAAPPATIPAGNADLA